MSRVGKQIITIPDSVELTNVDGVVKAKSPKGELQYSLPENVSLNIEGKEATVSIQDESNYRQNVVWGTANSLITNMVKGLSEGFSKQLEVNGVGYKVALSGKKLTLNLGYSHQIDYELPEGVQGTVEKNLITLSGIDKQQVGHVAAQIRKYRKPEPYKGKGIKYIDEVIRRKVGKAAASE